MSAPAKKGRKRAHAPASFVVKASAADAYGWALVANSGAVLAVSSQRWPRMQGAIDACCEIRDALRATDIPVTLDARKPAPLIVTPLPLSTPE